MSEKITGVGIIGCGTFVEAYTSTLGKVYQNVKVVCCSDLDLARAKAAAAEYGIPKACATEELLADPEVEIALIITPPGSHYSLAMAALKAGKHVYVEKPLAATFAQAAELVNYAKEHGLCIASAPDTFLTPELQAVRRALDEGKIGRVTAFTANVCWPGSDLWHPNADFLFKKGGGPMLDIGPYFLTALISLLGPLDEVFSYSNRAWDVRRVRDHDCTVEVPTNFSGVLKFKNGAVGSVNFSNDIWRNSLPAFELYGTDGVIFAPKPNTLHGPLKLLQAGPLKHDIETAEETFKKMTLIYAIGPAVDSYFTPLEPLGEARGNQRGLGVSDLASAITEGRKPRVSADLCLHVTEAVMALDGSEGFALPHRMQTDCERPAPLG